MNNRNNRYDGISKISIINQPGEIIREEKQPTGALIAFELILLAAAVAATVMFASMLVVDYHVDYRSLALPIHSTASLELSPLSGVSEDSIPKPVTPTEVVVDATEYEPPEFYDFSQPVPESEEQSIRSFDDAVFIGDSRMAGLIIYTKLTPYNYAATGVNINQLKSSKFIKYTDEDGNEQKVTVCEALELTKGDYDSVYISVGTNELGWNASQFISGLKSFVEAVKEVADVPIYIQLILPVTTEYEKNSQFGISNANAAVFNEEIRALAEDMQLYLLDPLSLFTLEDGTLDPEKSYDGAHLSPASCRDMAYFYQTHVVDEEVYRNKDTAPNKSDAKKELATIVKK